MANTRGVDPTDRGGLSVTDCSCWEGEEAQVGDSCSSGDSIDQANNVVTGRGTYERSGAQCCQTYTCTDYSGRCSNLPSTAEARQIMECRTPCPEAQQHRQEEEASTAAGIGNVGMLFGGLNQFAGSTLRGQVADVAAILTGTCGLVALGFMFDYVRAAVAERLSPPRAIVITLLQAAVGHIGLGGTMGPPLVIAPMV